MRTSFLLLTLLTSLLTGCITPIPLETVTYPNKANVISTKTAAVNISSGTISAGTEFLNVITPAGIFVPIIMPANLKLQFTEEDQQACGAALKSELSRLQIARINTTGIPPELKIDIVFPKTYYNPGMQIYTLDVEMQLSGGEKPFAKTYHFSSDEKDSIWEKLNTNAYQGKAKAVGLLLEKLIPDIEIYLGSMVASK